MRVQTSASGAQARRASVPCADLWGVPPLWSIIRQAWLLGGFKPPTWPQCLHSLVSRCFHSIHSFMISVIGRHARRLTTPTSGQHHATTTMHDDSCVHASSRSVVTAPRVALSRCAHLHLVCRLRCLRRAGVQRGALARGSTCACAAQRGRCPHCSKPAHVPVAPLSAAMSTSSRTLNLRSQCALARKSDACRRCRASAPRARATSSTYLVVKGVVKDEWHPHLPRSRLAPDFDAATACMCRTRAHMHTCMRAHTSSHACSTCATRVRV